MSCCAVLCRDMPFYVIFCRVVPSYAALRSTQPVARVDTQRYGNFHDSIQPDGIRST
ncbi:hypothetical protein HMPREF3214_01658 [Alloscardovia omnicolens]|nr:hypothetical protein HMPREF3214_01658 [Alloscardovia omnicolens]